jgi:hypothetical protein
VFGADGTRLPPARGGRLRHGGPLPAARHAGTHGRRGAVGVAPPLGDLAGGQRQRVWAQEEDAG